MKVIISNVLFLFGGLVIGYFLVKGLTGLGTLLYLVAVGLLWACLAFCIASVVLFPVTLIYWAIRSILRDMLK